MSQQKGRFRIIHASRELSPTTKMQSYMVDDPANPTKNNNELITNNFPVISTSQKPLEIHAPIRTITPSNNDFTIKSNAVQPSSIDMDKFYSIDVNKRKLDPLDSNKASTRCCSQLSPKQQALVKFAVVAVVIVVVVGALLPPVYIFIIRQSTIQSSYTNITVSGCATTTCIGKETPYHSSIATTIYPFDGSANDITGTASGSLFGNTIPGFINNAYVGTQTLNLGSNNNQYVQIPYINLAQQSFTLQMWIYLYNPINIPGEIGIFSQCDSNQICLLLTLRNARITLSFDAMNTNNNTLFTSTVLYSGRWYHVTIVYDAVLFQQSIYINGKIDALSRGMVSAYQGSSSGSVTTIGRSYSLAGGATYFNGRIDHFTTSVGVARTACQIYNDATLSAYYPFDTTGTYNDYSVNLFNGIASGVTTLSRGRLNQAIYLPTTPSYFQAPCFSSPRMYSFAFTFSIWVNPESVTGGGSLIHISSSQNGISGTCYDLLALTSTGSLVAQWIQGSGVLNGTLGPVIPAKTWTHVAVMYSSGNGLRLFVNGQLLASSQNTGSVSIQDFDSPMYVTLGSNNPWALATASVCLTGPITVLAGQFIGGMDQFRLYSRELDNQELCVLANV